MVKVSVIMPAHNVEQYIEQSVRSVMEQTLQEIELIVVDDASTDATWKKICEQKAVYGDKLQTIRLEENLRQGGARNRGIQVARGTYIAFVDSDDFIKADMLEAFYAAITESDADLAGTNGYYLYDVDGKIREIREYDAQLKAISNQPAAPSVKKQYYLYLRGLWRNIYKKDIIIQNDIWFPEGVSYEDNYFFMLYLGYVKQYAYVDGTFYYYRQNPTSTVHRKDQTQLQRVEIEKELLAEYQRRGLYEAVKDEYDIMTIKRWYVNTIGVIFTRFGKEGIAIAKAVKKEFLTYYPKYRKNQYYKALVPRAYRMMVRLFDLAPWLVYCIFQIKIKHRGRE